MNKLNVMLAPLSQILKGDPEGIYQVIMKSPQGEKYQIKRNTVAYIFLEISEVTEIGRITTSRQVTLIPDEQEEIIIDDINGVLLGVIIGNQVEINETVDVYNCHKIE